MAKNKKIKEKKYNNYLMGGDLPAPEIALFWKNLSLFRIIFEQKSHIIPP